MKKLRTYYLLFSCSLWTFAFEAIDGNEGEKCETSELPGVCTQLKHCSLALNSIRKGRPHNLRRCGFNGFEEVVCCPSASSRNPSIETTTRDKNVIWNDNNEVERSDEEIDNQQRVQSKRKCEKACEKIVKENRIMPTIQFNIIGGEDAKMGEYPHMAALGFTKNDAGNDETEMNWQLCAASLISSRFLLTAAHCFINQLAPDLKIVRLGVIQINSTSPRPQDYSVQTTMVHPKYNTRSRHNDIALIQVERNVKMTKYVRPACLYSENNDPTGLLVTGWGDILRGTGFQSSKTLQVAPLNPVSVSKCNSSLMTKSIQILSGRTIINTQICAMSPLSDACQGDSGGPLQIQRLDGAYAIVGIISYGSGCAGDTPGVYTRVSRYLSWIESYVWPD